VQETHEPPVCPRPLYETHSGQFVYFIALGAANCAVTLIAAYRGVYATITDAPRFLAAVHLKLSI